MSCSNSVRVTRTSEWKPGKFGGHGRGGLGGQPLLGLPALVAQPGQRTDGRRACGIGVVGFGDAGDDVVEQRLIDLVAGEVGIADGLADGVEVRVRVGQRDAGSAAAEIAERDNAVRWQARRGLQCGECGDGIGDQRGGHWPSGARLGLARNAPRSAPTVAAPQCAGTAIAIGCTSADGAGHRVEGFDEHLLAAVR